MSFDAPHSPPPGSDERELLLGFIRWQREQVVATVDGLTEAELRWTPDGKLLPIIGVVNHLAHMEWRWIEGRYLGSEFPPRDRGVRRSATPSPARRSSTRIGSRLSEPKPSCAPHPRSTFPVSATKAGAVRRTSCSASTSRSTSVGCCSTSSRRPRITPVMPTRPARCSTAERCAPNPRRPPEQEAAREGRDREPQDPPHAPRVVAGVGHAEEGHRGDDPAGREAGGRPAQESPADRDAARSPEETAEHREANIGRELVGVDRDASTPGAGSRARDAVAYDSTTAETRPTAITTDVPGAVIVPTDTRLRISSASIAAAASAAKPAVHAPAAAGLRNHGRSITAGSTRRSTCSYSSWIEVTVRDSSLEVKEQARVKADAADHPAKSALRFQASSRPSR